MQLILHQIRKEWMSQRWVLVFWYALLGVEWVVVGTDFLGGFNRSDSDMLGGTFTVVFHLLMVIGVVMIPASLALNDPPTQETAHWQALPVRSWHLLVAKFLVIVVFMLLPLCMTHIAALWLSDAFMWGGTALADLLSSYPSWMLLGFAFGAATGNWRRFSMLMTLFLSGVMLAIFLVESLHSMNSRLGYWMEGRGWETAIQNCYNNNVFLFGSVVVILLRYFTRFSGWMLSVMFLVCLPITVHFFPLFVWGFVQPYQTEDMIRDRKITIDYAPPNQLLTHTNQSILRVTGPSPYSKLTIEGLAGNYLMMPIRFDAALQAYKQNNPTVRKTFGSRTTFLHYFGDRLAYRDQAQERIFVFPKLQSGMDAINAIDLNAEQFDVFDLDATILKLIESFTVDLDTDWWVKPFRYEQMGELALKNGSEFSSNGITARLVAWLPDGEDRTQIKLHIRMLRLSKVGRKDNPRWDLSMFRFVLINEQTQEVCFTTASVPSGLVDDLCQIGYHYVILNFSVPADSGVTMPVPLEWLNHAKLRVFRLIPGIQAKVDHFMEDVPINDLPILPRPDPSSMENQ